MAVANPISDAPSTIRSTPIAKPMNQMLESGICTSKVIPRANETRPEKTDQPQWKADLSLCGQADSLEITIFKKASKLHLKSPVFLGRVVLSFRKGTKIEKEWHPLEDLQRGEGLHVSKNVKISGEIQISVQEA